MCREIQILERGAQRNIWTDRQTDRENPMLSFITATFHITLLAWSIKKGDIGGLQARKSGNCDPVVDVAIIFT
jgi:hypothetical protein